MRRFIGWIRRHLDSWDKICIDNSARLRLNLILFSFVISIVFLAMSIRTANALDFRAALSTILFGLVTLSLFLWQFFHNDYSVVAAWLFGLMSLAMAVFFISTGGLESTGHIWICVLPIVGTMMVPFRSTLIYNGVLLAVLVCLLKGPFYIHIPAQYSSYMRTVFPISILVLILCNYVAEYTRQRTQKQLITMTEKLRDSAFTDPLTGAYNRRALTSHFGEPNESAYGLSFAMLDLDFFKRVNDTYGHEVGDKLLCQLVTLVKKNIPPGAQLYRWGGEEFLLALKSSDTDALHGVLESIRRDVAETPLMIPSAVDEPPELLSTTVSIGGMVASPRDNIERSINFADEQMYFAKKAGRNMVMIKS